MVGHVLISPEAILAAAAELDLVAERLAAASMITAPATHVIPSGAEEVSLVSAGHFNQGAMSHDHAIAQGILELHHAAQTLRLQLAQHIAGDVVRAVGVNAIQI